MYADAFHNKETNQIYVVERVNDIRVYKNFKAEYSFYYKNPNGKYLSINGEQLGKFETNNSKRFYSELKSFDDEQKYESDVKPVFKALEKYYPNADLPELHNAAIDIEVDFCKEKGYAPTHDPHQPITAISIHYDWLDKTATVVLAPKTLTQEQAQAICDRFENCILCETENQLIELFYELIEDVDVLYTWNGEGFDIPYIVNRTIRVLGKEYTRKFCLWNMLPKEKEYERFGKTEKTYEIFGRVHLDYLLVYKKFVTQKKHSYKLDSIGEEELGQNKTSYSGTLDQLYNNDFEKFIEYNRQDVILLSNLDAKLKFLGLINTLAHEAGVLMQNTLGTVALTDQAIILEAHRRNLIVPDRKSAKEFNMQIAGGYVAEPKSGKLWSWIGSTDISSLYPSTIRTLNMSPETLVAQVVHTITDPYLDEKIATGVKFSDAWNGLFSCFEYIEIMNQTDKELYVHFEKENETQMMTAKEIYEFIFTNDNYCISANGTIFDSKNEGVVPGLLNRWYADRKVMQTKKKKLDKLVDKETDPNKKKILMKERDFWDQRQHARKINLNALYGALANAASRFADQRIGQSTTLTGRSITQHMNAKVNEVLAGEYKYDGISVCYSDTDSIYFTVEPVMQQLKNNGFVITKDSFANMSDNIADLINESFPEFIEKKFNIIKDRQALIKCGRENCAINGLFPSKKRYAMLVYDKEGIRKDVDGKQGELKIMGMDTQRADTPKTIQIFLKEILTQVLEGKTCDEVVDFIRDFRKTIKSSNAWDLGMPKQVNNLTSYKQRIKANKKTAVKGFTVPGHVQASLNWNTLREMNGDNSSLPIMDGQKVVVCSLKDNPSKMRSVAYPIDEQHLPAWFTTLPFDIALMEDKLIDTKLDNVIGSLGWNLSLSKMSSSFKTLFTFEE